MINTYISIDLETTGLNPKQDKIIEIGAVKVEEGKITDTFSQLINPGRRLEERIVELTGITDKDLEQYRYIEKDGLYEFVTIPFESSTCVVTEQRNELEPGEIDKFTVVLWLEGNDPECLDDIKGGVLGLGMKFTKTND